MKIKACLSSLETTMRALNAFDEADYTHEQIQGLLAAKRAELAEIEERIALTKDMDTQEAAEHSDRQRQRAEEQEKWRDESERQRAELRALNAKLKEVQAQHANVVEGLAALHLRISGGL
jgi:DNA-binding transcriptional MerR regulator